ncbi:DUF5995 family protein [Streptomyces sp. HU2014]|uniref:DUF5995 family protein n=1 Tax=Streptomyces sp. HU2014 TaxID=2939414 RepID=UPI00200D087D|nr:DUF5995 family protein [Streptomyces sp. HU2014]UQI45212.1 DUF5995 family protein [Streptomyces sp. HU2014]
MTTPGGLSPAEKVERVARELALRVGRYDAERDHRAAFAYTYYRLTTSLTTALRTGTPPFAEPDWVADLSVSLASAYFSAMDATDTWLAAFPRSGGEVAPGDLPDAVPPPWRDVYAASSVRHSYVLEEVLFSMMAHMSYDLPLALRSLDARAGNHRHIGDFHRMNDLLATCVDEVQDDLAARYCRGLRSLDRLFTRDDELFTNYGIRMARGLAWFNSDRLREPTSADAATASISRSTAAFITRIRFPGDWKLRAVSRLLRLLIPPRRQWPAPGTPID